MTRLFSLLLVVSALVGGTPASAQTISVRTLALRSGEMPEVYLKGPEEYFPLQFSAAQPSQPVRALAANPLPLYTSKMDDEGDQAFVAAHKLKIPAGAKGILLVAWNTGDEARYVAIKDDFGSARYNDWLLINAATRPVAFMVGKSAKAMVVAPGTSTTHRISAKKGEGAAVLAQAPIDGEAKTFYSTYWPVYADKRTVVLFVDDGPKIRVKRISDKLPPVKP